MSIERFREWQTNFSVLLVYGGKNGKNIIVKNVVKNEQIFLFLGQQEQVYHPDPGTK